MREKKDGKPFYSRFFPPQHVLLPMTIFGFSCVFMYFTDRTSLYLKIQKQFDFWQFTIAMVLALALGLGTLKKPEKDLGFLNRDQTDEVSYCAFVAVIAVGDIDTVADRLRILFFLNSVVYSGKDGCRLLSLFIITIWPVGYRAFTTLFASWSRQ